MKTIISIKNLGLVLLAVGFLFLSGCRKDYLPCELENWGSLKVINTSSQDVRVYLDGEFLTDVYIDSYVEMDHLPAGTHYIHAEQLSLGQTWDNTVVILQCDRLNLAFTP